MKEVAFQKRVTDMATRFGWRWWHVPAPMIAAGSEWRPYRKGAGVPDLILIHDDPPRLVFIELKGDGGKLTDTQREFLQAASLVADAACIPDEKTHWNQPPAAIGVYAFWPKDEPLIEQLLRSKRLT